MTNLHTSLFDVALSYEDLRRRCNRIRAMLGALDGLAVTAASWDAATDDTLAVHVASMKADDELEAAEAVEGLAARDWDRALRALSARSLDLAGAPSRAPHVELFGVIGAEDATRLGPGKATLIGRGLTELGRQLMERESGFAPLGEPLSELEAATRRLEAAAAARDKESEQRFAFTLAKAQLVRRLEHLADQTRLAILRAQPGRADLVADVLEA